MAELLDGQLAKHRELSHDPHRTFLLISWVSPTWWVLGAVYSKLNWQRPLLGWDWLWSSSFTHCWTFSMAVAMQPGNALPSPRRTFGSSTFQVLTPVAFWLWCVNPRISMGKILQPSILNKPNELFSKNGCLFRGETWVHSKKGNGSRAIKKMTRVFEVTVSVISAEKCEG